MTTRLPGKALRRALESATVLTWLNFGFRFAAPVMLLPLVERHLSLTEVALWLLFLSVGTLFRAADFGFHSTFARLIALAMGAPGRGAESGRGGDAPVAALLRSMQVSYRRLTFTSLVVGALVGTAALWRPIQAIDAPGAGWLAWTVVLLGCTATLAANRFTSYLVGTDRIAELRRAEIVLNALELGTTVAVLLLGYGLVPMVAASQSWAFVRYTWLRALSSNRESADTSVVGGETVPESPGTDVWALAWRSGAGAFMTMASIRGSGLALAQVADAGTVASYVLAVTAIEALSTLSQVPLFTQLPALARLHARGERSAQIALAARRFRLSMWTFAAGAVLVGATAERVLGLLGTSVGFVSPAMWFVLALGFFFHRYGALHIQLYSLTNHILSHVADSVAAMVAVVVSVALYPQMGAIALPVGFLAGYAGFYIWYSARYSYRAFGLRPAQFEPSVTLVPLAGLVVGLLLLWR